MIAKKAQQLERLRNQRSEVRTRLDAIEKRIERVIAEIKDEIRDEHPPTEREQQVIALVRARKVDKEIAAALNIATRTAKYHVAKLLKKYGIHSRHDL